MILETHALAIALAHLLHLHYDPISDLRIHGDLLLPASVRVNSS